MDLLANKKCAQVTQTYLYCYFVLRSHGPIWSPFCALSTWTYTIAILCSDHMDLFCICELAAQRLNMKSKSEGIWYQQKIWEIIVIVVIPVIMGSSGNNSLFCVKIKYMQPQPHLDPYPALFGPAPCRPHTLPHLGSVFGLCDFLHLHHLDFGPLHLLTAHVQLLYRLAHFVWIAG